MSELSTEKEPLLFCFLQLMWHTIFQLSPDLLSDRSKDRNRNLSCGISKTVWTRHKILCLRATKRADYENRGLGPLDKSYVVLFPVGYCTAPALHHSRKSAWSLWMSYLIMHSWHNKKNKQKKISVNFSLRLTCSLSKMVIRIDSPQLPL